MDSVSGHSNGAMCPLITDSGTTKNQHDTMYRDQTLPQTESNNGTAGNDSNNIEKVLHNSCNAEDNSKVYFHRYITAETETNKSFICTTCGLQLTDKMLTKLHMRTHRGNKNVFGYRKINLDEKISYVCLSCGDQFSCKSNIKLHIGQIHMTASTEFHGTDRSICSNKLPKNKIGASKSSVNVTELPIGQLAVNTDNIIANEKVLSDIPAHIIEANIYWDHSYVKKSTTEADLPLHTTEKHFVNRKRGKRGRRRKKTSTRIWPRSATKLYPKDSNETLTKEEQDDEEKTSYPTEDPAAGTHDSQDKLSDKYEPETVDNGKIGGRRRRRPGRLGYYNTVTSRDSDESMEDDRSEKCIVNEDPDFNPSDNNESSETESESDTEFSDISSDEISVTSKRIKLSKKNDTSSVHTGKDTEDTLNNPKKGNYEQIYVDQSESEEAGYSSENVRNLNVALTKMKKDGKRIDKKRCCLYCNKQYCRISKHLQQVHYKETEVQKALSYSKNSWKRKRKWRKLVYKCNFSSNMKTLEKGKGDLVPCHRPNLEKRVNASDYVQCEGCLGTFQRKSLKKHIKHGHCHLEMEINVIPQQENEYSETADKKLVTRQINLDRKVDLSSENRLQDGDIEVDKSDTEKDLNKGAGEIISHRRPKVKTNAKATDFLQWRDCLRTYLRIEMPKHGRNCKQRKRKVVPKEMNQSEKGIHEAVSRNTKEKILEKRHCCLYCCKYYIKISRHLEAKHSKEEDVQKALSYSTKSKERAAIWLDLLNQGDNANNMSVLEKSQGEIMPRYRPKLGRKVKVSDFVQCSNCFGSFSRTALRNHLKNCRHHKSKKK